MKEDESVKEETKPSSCLVDDDITMESIIEEDPLYNQFTYTQLRAMYALRNCKYAAFTNSIVAPMCGPRMAFRRIGSL